MSIISEEEKKAIEWLEKAEFFSARLYKHIILNLIKKQQKKIEKEHQNAKDIAKGGQLIAMECDRLNNKNKKLQKEIEELKQENDELDFMTIHMNGFYNGEKKWKDKIKEKINKLKKNDIEYSETIAILEKILEEN